MYQTHAMSRYFPSSSDIQKQLRTIPGCTGHERFSSVQLVRPGVYSPIQLHVHIDPKSKQMCTNQNTVTAELISIFLTSTVLSFSTSSCALYCTYSQVLQFLYAGCLCHFSTSLLLDSSLDCCTLALDQTNLLAYDIKDTRDILYKEVCFIHFFYHVHVRTQSHLYIVAAKPRQACMGPVICWKLPKGLIPGGVGHARAVT